MREIEAGAKRLAQVILGASHLAQSAVPKLLEKGDTSVDEWKAELRRTLEGQANFLVAGLSAIPGLQVLDSQGAMYLMARIDAEQFDESIRSDLDFCKLLLEEENVFALPGTCFGVEKTVRLVFCAPIPVLGQATARIQEFCHRHRCCAAGT